MNNPQYIVSNDIKRVDYERLVALISAQTGRSADQIKNEYSLAQDVLIVGAYPTGDNSTIQFALNDGTGSPVPGSKLLAKNDFFLVDGLGIRFSRCDYNGGVYSNHGNYRKYTDADPAVFSYTKTGAKPEAQALNTVLNGWLSYKVGAEIKIDRHLVQELTYSPTSTYTATSNPGFAGGEINTRGFLHTVPNHVMSGGDDNVMNIDLAIGEKSNIDGSISAATTASTTRNVVWLMVSGWVLKSMANSAKCDVTKV